MTISEIYDPSMGKWNTTGRLTTAHQFHTATLLNSGKVLVDGGDEDAAYMASCEIYDPLMGQWSPATIMGKPRTFHTATMLNSAQILVTGGEKLGSDVNIDRPEKKSIVHL